MYNRYARHQNNRCDWCSTQFLNARNLNHHAESTTRTYLEVHRDGSPLTSSSPKICVAKAEQVNKSLSQVQEEDDDFNDPWFDDEHTKLSKDQGSQENASVNTQQLLGVYDHGHLDTDDNDDDTLFASDYPNDSDVLYSSGYQDTAFWTHEIIPVARSQEFEKLISASPAHKTLPPLDPVLRVTSQLQAVLVLRTVCQRNTEEHERGACSLGRLYLGPYRNLWTILLLVYTFRSHIAKVVLPFSLPYSSTQHDAASVEETIHRILAYVGHDLEPVSTQNMASKQELLRDDLQSMLYHQTISHVRSYENGIGKVFTSEWLAYLDTRGILLDPMDELNWSGRGQHVEYQSTEESMIPLSSEMILGHSASAIVDKVRCRRIKLARKKIRCRGRLTKKEAVTEVEHLKQLQHTHIVGVVGTYTLGKYLAILIYPAAQWNLEEFMEAIEEEDECIATDVSRGPWHHWDRREALLGFIGCLSQAIDFIHGKNIKHMDIKPKNLLIQQRTSRTYRIYIADFGIARAYKSLEESETDSPISFTRTYAAPEVVLQETRGFSADIFSLDCVYMEAFATMVDERQVLLEQRLANSSDTIYQANTTAVVLWCQKTMLDHGWRYSKTGNVLQVRHSVVNLVVEMLNISPHLRPSSETLKAATADLGCSECDTGSEPFQAAAAEAEERRRSC